jgi:hypothetical protein
MTYRFLKERELKLSPYDAGPGTAGFAASRTSDVPGRKSAPVLSPGVFIRSRVEYPRIRLAAGEL